MPTKYSAQGLTLEVEIAIVFTAIGSLKNVDLPDDKVQYYDGTCLDSGISIEDGELTGQTQPGSFGGELFYDPADSVHSLLAADPSLGGVYREFRSTMPDTGASVASWPGSVTGFQPKGQTKDGFMATLSGKSRLVATMPTPT